VRILVVEDEVKLAGHLRRALMHDGHDPHVVHDGLAGLREAGTGKYDLILLDVELPGLDGFEVLRQLRAAQNVTRVIMLTARGEIPDKVTGLMSGADDYLAKPFAMNELLARINAVGRRFVAPAGEKLQVGSLTMTLGEREVSRGGRRIPLSEREHALLQVLMREPGRVFSRAELSERVWAREHDYDARLVEVYISRLRRKIDEESGEPPLIHTMRHLGYTVRAEEPPP
jgi:DNA-binding response OmpR family regulator